MRHVVSVAIDDGLLERITKYRNSMQIAPKQATAIRVLIERGLEAEEREKGLKAAPREDRA